MTFLSPRTNKPSRQPKEKATLFARLGIASIMFAEENEMRPSLVHCGPIERELMSSMLRRPNPRR